MQMQRKERIKIIKKCKLQLLKFVGFTAADLLL